MFVVQDWQQNDATLILEVLARLDEHVLEIGSHVVRIRSLLRTRMERKRKKITLSREFYERHEWIQQKVAERLEAERKLREQRPQPRD
jgi:hypothetical protein